MLVASALIVHEIGHISAALLLRLKVTEVVLFPFGGQAKIEDLSILEPYKEISICLAGPAASLAAALIIHTWGLYHGNSQFPWLAKINLLLGVFNLFPAIPLDGGHILRAILAKTFGYKKAVRCSSVIGRLIAACLAVYGICFFGPNISGANYLFIGGFLFWGAYREEKYSTYSFLRLIINKKQDLKKQGVLPSRVLVSTDECLVRTVLNQVGSSYYIVIIVLNEEFQVTDTLSETELIECLLEKGPGARIKDCK
ncbi:MAG: site-2 protease family protein [Syntrophomonadaceae bacterium]